LQTLIAAHLVIEVSGIEPAYTPGRPLEQINAHHILQAMRARGQELLTRNEPVREEVYGEFARIQEAEKLAASSISMLALVHRADARLELAPLPKETSGLPELVPAAKPPAEPAPEHKQVIEISEAIEEVKAEAPASTANPEVAPKATEPIAIVRPIAEPITDEERNFPL